MGKLIRNGIEYGGGNGTDIFEVTQAEYDALKQAGTLVHNALYVITDAPNLNPTASDIEYSSGVTVADELTSLATIGTIINGTESGSTSCPNDTVTEVGSITLDKGVYVIVSGCDWDSNATGFRQIGITAAKNGARAELSTTMACTGSTKETYHQFVKIQNVTSDNTTIKIYACQNSGSTLNAYPYINAVKLA